MKIRCTQKISVLQYFRTKLYLIHFIRIDNKTARQKLIVLLMHKTCNKCYSTKDKANKKLLT